MREITATADIPAAADELFAFLSDPTNLPEWQTGIASARKTTPGPVGVGSRAHVVRELMGQRLAVDLAITAYEPGRRLVLESSASGMGVVARLELQPLEPPTAGTRLTFAMEVRAQNMFMAPVEGMVAGAAKADLADSLARLKARFATE